MNCINTSIIIFLLGEGLLALVCANEITVEGKDLQSYEAAVSKGRGRREDSVERDIAILRSLVERSHHMILDLDLVSLWEGVTCINSTHSWKIVQHICHNLYEVGVALSVYSAGHCVCVCV